jgi:hypothetical protein
MKASDYATQTQNLCQRWSDEDDVFTFAEAYAEVENAELQRTIAAKDARIAELEKKCCFTISVPLPFVLEEE